MTRATTANFADTTVEIEWVASSGTYATVCGITQNDITRQHNMSTTEVPDCDDESLPAAVERAVQSSEQSISGSGVWSAQSHGKLLDWWRSGATLNVRIHHTKAATGDIEYETGPAYIVNCNNSRQRGQKVTGTLDIQFDGIPAVTRKS